MEISIKEAEIHFLSLVQSLIDGKEETIYISKDGKLVAQLTLAESSSSKRIGVAKEEMSGFDISQEEFNSIPIDFN